MEARALKKNIRLSPRKMRLVIDLVRGKKANEALTMLRFHPKHAAQEAEMVLRSAIANLNNKANEEGIRIRDEEIVIKTIKADCAAFFKRMRPRAKGMGNRIRKRSNHLTIVVGMEDKK
jgi:large subunit ribosomal protein L22